MAKKYGNLGKSRDQSRLLRETASEAEEELNENDRRKSGDFDVLAEGIDDD